MIVFDADHPLSPTAVKITIEIAHQMIDEHDGPYSAPWREEKRRRVDQAEDRGNATLHDLVAWMDQQHRMRFLGRVDDYRAPMTVDWPPVRDAKEELMERMRFLVERD